MATTTTRSLRLTKVESAAMTALAERQSLSEGAMLKKLFRDGLRASLVDTAVAAYCTGEVSIGEAAQMADVPYLTFFEELRRRRIAVLDETANLPAELAELAEEFDDSRLAQAAHALATD